MNSPIVRLKLDAGWWWLEPWNFEWLSIFCWKCHNIPTDELTHSIIFFRVGRVFVLKTTNFQRLPHIPKEYPYKISPPNHGDVHPMKSAVNLRLPGPPMRSAWSKAPREFDHPREFPTKSLREALNSGDLQGNPLGMAVWMEIWMFFFLFSGQNSIQNGFPLEKLHFDVEKSTVNVLHFDVEKFSPWT